MLLSLRFFQPALGRTIDQYIAFDRRGWDVIERHTERINARYLGIYAVAGWPQYKFVEIAVLDGTGSTKEALFHPAAFPDDPDATQFLQQRRTYTAGVTAVILDPAVPSPNLNGAFALEHSVVRVVLAGLAQGTTFSSLAAFDRRVTGKYSTFMAQIGWYYTGIYRIEGLANFGFAVVDVIRAESPKDAIAKDKAHQPTAEITGIYSQARTFYGLPLQTFWLTPLALTPAAKGAFRFAK